MDIYQDKNDWWVGYYRGDDHHYVCPVPTLVIRWPRKSSPLAGIRRGPLPPGVRRGVRPDVRRITLRPVNLDQPPSTIRQALFRQRPTRGLKDDEGTD